MKLLFDENLAPSLVRRLADLFPDSAHAHAAGLGSSDDRDIWEYARTNGFVIATKDSDFQERAALEGAPPKVVWIRSGNCSVEETERVLRRHEALIRAFGESPTDVVLMLT